MLDWNSIKHVGHLVTARIVVSVHLYWFLLAYLAHTHFFSAKQKTELNEGRRHGGMDSNCGSRLRILRINNLDERVEK